ncbi:MAG: hypothetical protein KatS3mg070_1353 [Meiothermus sp.]|nr:MAG: hypothetical protein KatS3mg070_1353 [Meiothermus sp.]
MLANKWINCCETSGLLSRCPMGNFAPWPINASRVYALPMSQDEEKSVVAHSVFSPKFTLLSYLASNLELWFEPHSSL